MYKNRLGGAISTTVFFFGAEWIVQLLNVFSGYRLTGFGIHPRDTAGLSGILFAPFIHAGWAHLIANTSMGVVLLFLLALSGTRVVWTATAIIALIAGLGTWLFAQPFSVHVGASSLIFGWLVFLILRGWFNRSAWQLLLGVGLFFVYGGVLWGVLPGTPGISWQGHLFGAIGGAVAAWAMAKWWLRGVASVATRR